MPYLFSICPTKRRPDDLLLGFLFLFYRGLSSSSTALLRCFWRAHHLLHADPRPSPTGRSTLHVHAGNAGIPINKTDIFRAKYWWTVGRRWKTSHTSPTWGKTKQKEGPEVNKSIGSSYLIMGIHRVVHPVHASIFAPFFFPFCRRRSRGTSFDVKGRERERGNMLAAGFSLLTIEWKWAGEAFSLLSLSLSLSLSFVFARRKGKRFSLIFSGGSGGRGGGGGGGSRWGTGGLA